MRILFATDASENADSAVHFLTKTPLSEPIELILLSVVQMPELHHVLGSEEYASEFYHKCEIKIRENFEQISKILDGLPIRYEQHIVRGHPGKTIVEEADKRRVDLILLGAVGESLIDRILLGSTSEFVATHAKSSVLVVRPPIRELSEQRILVSYDGSSQAEYAFGQLAESGWAHRSPIDLLYVVPLSASRSGSGSAQEQAQQTAMQTLSSLQSRPEFASLDITPQVLPASHVGKAICQFASDRSTGLIVLGSTGRGFIARILLGSVSRYVLHHAPCSVWVSRNGN